jgi:hypothetical protein
MVAELTEQRNGVLERIRAMNEMVEHGTLMEHWPAIRALFRDTLDITIASISEDGSPHITPIGSVFLRKDCTGYYIERFPSRLPRNIERDKRICVFAIRNDLGTWLPAMLRGRFAKPVAVRLHGRAGVKRELTPEERDLFLRKVRIFKWTRGYRLLWGDLTHARELVFDGFEPVRAGAMTRGLWVE